MPGKTSGTRAATAASKVVTDGRTDINNFEDRSSECVEPDTFDEITYDQLNMTIAVLS